MKISRKELRKIILEQVAQDQAPEDEPKEKVKPTSKVYLYLKQRAEKVDHYLFRTLSLRLAEEYMQGTISKDEALENIIKMEKNVRAADQKGTLGLVKSLFC